MHVKTNRGRTHNGEERKAFKAPRFKDPNVKFAGPLDMFKLDGIVKRIMSKGFEPRSSELSAEVVNQVNALMNSGVVPLTQEAQSDTERQVEQALVSRGFPVFKATKFSTWQVELNVKSSTGETVTVPFIVEASSQGEAFTKATEEAKREGVEVVGAVTATNLFAASPDLRAKYGADNPQEYLADEEFVQYLLDSEAWTPERIEGQRTITGPNPELLADYNKYMEKKELGSPENFLVDAGAAALPEGSDPGKVDA